MEREHQSHEFWFEVIFPGCWEELAGQFPLTSQGKEKIFRKKEEKNTPRASDIPLANGKNGHFVPLTNFLAVLGETGQW